MPLFTDPLKEIDAASVKEYAQQRGAEELSDDIVNEACQRVMELAKPKASCHLGGRSFLLWCNSVYLKNGFEDDRLAAVRTDGNDAQGHADEFADPFDIMTSCFRQFIIGFAV